MQSVSADFIKHFDNDLESWLRTEVERKMSDNVNHPSHYETGKFECFDVMKLKSCPFCGGEAYYSYGDDYWYVRCFECGANVKSYMGCEYGPEYMKKHRKLVIDIWNRRVADD